MNKKKIINDPVYGFVTIPTELIFDVMEHPYVQRLRYIKQVSMTHLVYPGALHTRFQHVLGAMHLMGMALETLRAKGVPLTPEEGEAACIAVLLHDIGHGPFSHSLEHTLVEGVSHEMLSSWLMDELNRYFGGRLEMAIAIFNNRYDKKFLHQLVSSQLDVDRMDYLNRDSFFTGVSEGVISFDRIIKMLNIVDNEIVVEEKGIYSVEKFLLARRLMYWQVYLHKTVLSAEGMLLRVLKRAKQLYQDGESLPVSPSLEHFLRNKITQRHFEADNLHLKHFARLDDVDILSAIKSWASHPDRILSSMCSGLVKRDLYHTALFNEDPGVDYIARWREMATKHLGVEGSDLDYFVWVQTIQNSAYDPAQDPIRILMKNGAVLDISKASDLSNVEALSKKVNKYAVSFPKIFLDGQIKTLR